MKQKFDLRLLFLMLCATLFTACGSDNDKDDATLSISPEKSTIRFLAEGGKETFNVETNQGSWDAKPDANKDWCKVTKEQNKFTIEVAENTSNEARTATISISAGKAKILKIEVSQAGVGAQLIVSDESPITFEADSKDAYTIEVTTNQPSWEVESSQKDWCIVTKEGNKFTISALQNLSNEKRMASVTVSAGNAGKISIEVTQKAAQEGGDEGKGEDTGLSIWEDTHWRLYQLKGNPKSVILNGLEVKFSTNGKVISQGRADGTGWTMLYEYDKLGRLTKWTEIDIPKNDVEIIVQLKYGNHSKYVPTTSLGGEMIDGPAVDYLSKGIVELNMNEGEDIYTLTEEGSTLKTKNDEEEMIITYSGNYPVSMVSTSYDANGKPDEIYTTRYTYGKNYKYKEVTEEDQIKMENGEWNTSVYITKFVVDNTIYHLTLESDGTKYEYDEKGRISKKVYSYGSTTTYSNYKEDSKGNWIERTITYSDNYGNPQSETETRTIVYH